eukprot:214391_1
MSPMLKGFYQVILMLIPVFAVRVEQIVTYQGPETWVVIEDDDIAMNALLHKIEEEIQYHTNKLNELQRRKNQILHGTIHNLIHIQSNISHQPGTDNAISQASTDWITNQTKSPTTASPTNDLTIEPATQPTLHPTQPPTSKPTNHPSFKPTKKPTLKPTKKPTNTPTHNPTKKPTIVWDKKPQAKTSARITHRKTGKLNDASNALDEDVDALLNTYRESQRTVRLYSIESADLASIQHLELELLSNEFQKNDLVLFTSCHGRPIARDNIKHGSAIRYYSNYDSAFMLCQDFIRYLYYYDARLITPQRDLVSEFIKTSHQSLAQFPRSVGSSIFEKTERHLRNDHVLVQVLHCWRKSWQQRMDSSNAVLHMPHNNYNAIVTVFFKYFNCFMATMLHQKLLRIDQANTPYFDYSEVRNDSIIQLPFWAGTAWSWFYDYNVTKTNEFVSKNVFQHATSRMFALCQRITGLKAALDVTQRMEQWRSNGTGAVAGVVTYPSNEMIDMLNDIGFTGNRLQIWTAQRQNHHVQKGGKPTAMFKYVRRTLTLVTK